MDRLSIPRTLLAALAAAAISQGALAAEPEVAAVGADRLAEQNIDSITELAIRTPGLIATGSNSEFAQAMSRGFVIDNYLLDGVPTVTSLGQDADLFLYDHVEILRGGLSRAVGGPGGAINLVRKRPLADPTVSGAVGGGSWDNGRGEIDVSAPVAANLALRAGLAYQDRDQFFDTAHQSRRVAFATVQAALGQATQLRLGAHNDHYRGADFLGLPGVPNTSLQPDLARSTYGAPAWNRDDLDTTGAFGELSHVWGNGWSARLSGSYGKSKREFGLSTLTGFVAPPALQGLALLETSQRSQDQETVSFVVQARGPIGSHGLLLVGADDMGARQTDGFAPGPNLVVNLYAPPFMPPAPSAPLAPNDQSRVSQHGVYGQAELRPASALTLTLGGRFDWYRRETRPAGVAVPWSRIETRGRFTPNLGLVWRMTRDWSAYASYDEAFEPQSGQTRDGRPIGPVESRQYELGVKLLTPDARLLMSLALYRIDQTGRQIPDPSLVVYYVAAGEVRSQGVELQIDGEIAPGWRLNAGYGYNDNEDLRDSIFSVAEGRRYALAMPKHSAKLWTDYRPADGPFHRLSVGGGVRWQSRTNGFLTLADVPVDIRQPVYAVADVRLAYDVTDDVTLAANLNNIFDQHYYERVNGVQSGNLYGAPRNVYISVRARF